MKAVNVRSLLSVSDEDMLCFAEKVDDVDGLREGDCVCPLAVRSYDWVWVWVTVDERVPVGVGSEKLWDEVKKVLDFCCESVRVFTEAVRKDECVGETVHVRSAENVNVSVLGTENDSDKDGVRDELSVDV